MTIQINNLQKSNLSEKNEYKWNGFYRALVIDAHDERQLGRVKVRIPDLMPDQGDDFTLDWKLNGLWAHPGNNYLGGRNEQDTMGQRADFDDAWYQGSCLIPPEGSWVFIFFENGDPNHPYYFGAGDYGQRKVLPENQNGAEWEKKWTLIKTRQGRCIVLSDDPDDERVEITGKKRQITNEPDGDMASVFTVDDNMTHIFLDERDGEEKLEIKDYRGNFLTFHTNDAAAVDQLHIFFHDEIHIETESSLFIKTGADMQCDVGGNFAVTAGGKIDTKAAGSHKEKALSFDRMALTVDNRVGLVSVSDTGGVRCSHLGGVQMNNSAGVQMKNTSGGTNDLYGGATLNMTGSAIVNQSSAGMVNVNGALTNVQCGAALSSFSIPIMIPLLAASAASAIVDGLRRQDPIDQNVPSPVVPVESLEAVITKNQPPVIGDPYDIVVGGVEHVPPEVVPPNPQQPVVLLPGVYPPEPPSPGPIVRQAGVGHMHAISLKDEYRDKIIPLIDKSYGKFTGFYVFKDLQPSKIDNEFIDPAAIPVYNNYRNPSSWVIDDTTKWWKNLDAFLKQAQKYDITVIPTLFDFCCSPYDPFITKLPKPYKVYNWLEEAQGEFVRMFVRHLRVSTVNFILNLGVKGYNRNVKPVDLLPSSGWLRELITFLLEDVGLPSNRIALTADSDSNLYDKNPYCRYKMYTGSKAPQEDEINDEEYVDGNWGGTGRAAVYNNDGDLINGYAKFIVDSGEVGIPCMNMWKMRDFKSQMPDGMLITDPNAMNYIFAPNQREGMRIILGDSETNDGFIDFS